MVTYCISFCLEMQEVFEQVIKQVWLANDFAHQICRITLRWYVLYIAQSICDHRSNMVDTVGYMAGMFAAPS